MKFSVQPEFRGNNDINVFRKRRKYNFFFRPGNRWHSDGASSGHMMCDQENDRNDTPFSSWLHVPGETGYCRASKRLSYEIPAESFLQNVLQLHQQR